METYENIDSAEDFLEVSASFQITQINTEKDAFYFQRNGVTHPFLLSWTQP